jgi:hypothetical protein
VAFEILCEQIHEHDIRLPLHLRGLLAEAGEQMGAASHYWEQHEGRSGAIRKYSRLLHPRHEAICPECYRRIRGVPSAGSRPLLAVEAVAKPPGRKSQDRVPNGCASVGRRRHCVLFRVLYDPNVTTTPMSVLLVVLGDSGDVDAYAQTPSAAPQGGLSPNADAVRAQRPRSARFRRCRALPRTRPPGAVTF